MYQWADDPARGDEDEGAWGFEEEASNWILKITEREKRNIHLDSKAVNRDEKIEKLGIYADRDR